MGLFLVPDYPILAGTKAQFCRSAILRSLPCFLFNILFLFLFHTPFSLASRKRRRIPLSSIYTRYRIHTRCSFFIVAYYLDCLVLKSNSLALSSTSYVSFARTKNEQNENYILLLLSYTTQCLSRCNERVLQRSRKSERDSCFVHVPVCITWS